MSIITKVFVVLVTILSVLLVALIVPFVANTEDFRSELEDLERRVEVAETAAEVAQIEKDAVQRLLSEEQLEKERVTSDLIRQLETRDQQLRDAEAAARQAEAAAARVEQTLAKYSASDEVKTGIIERQLNQLEARRTEARTQRERVIELTDQSTELTARLETLDRQFRQLRERLVGLQEENAELEALLDRLPPALLAELRGEDAGGGTSLAALPPEGVQIAGQVTDVRQIAGDTFVQLNVGSQDAVRENMEFLVFRGADQYLGTVVVDNVTDQASTARLRLAAAGAEVRPGDQVLAGDF